MEEPRVNWDSLKRRMLTGRTLFLAIVVLTGLLEIFAWIIAPPSGWEGIVSSVIYIAAIFALPLAGRYAAWVIVAVACIDEVLPGVVALDEGMGLVLSMLLLGYASRHWSDALAWTAIVVSAGYDMYRFPEDAGYAFPQGMIGMALGYGLPYCCGIILWQRQSLRKAQKNRERLNAYQRDIAIASRIHESVSGSLARIMLETQRLSGDENAELRRGLMEIQSSAEQALRDTHAVIDYLDDDGMRASKRPPRSSYMETLESVAHSGDRRLCSQGFDGKSVIHGVCLMNVDEQCALSLEILREVYANIEKHAGRKGTGYHVNVVVSGNRFILSQTNSLLHEEHWMEPPRSSRGLELLAKRVRAYGGEMRWAEDDDMWSLFCSLPLVHRDA